MGQEIEEKENGTKGIEVIVPCTKCLGKTAHVVVASVDQRGDDHDNDLQWYQHYQIVRCLGCKTITFRDESSTSEDVFQVGPNEFEQAITERLFPSRLEGRKDLGSEVAYLPMDTRRIYRETISALNNNSPVLAGIGLRALVETVCKEKNAVGDNLSKKIDNLAAQQVLTPGGAKVLHKIRTLGNAAAHEVKPHSDEQLALGMDVVEHMLRDVYILPKLIEEKF